ncbi:MAG: DUF115 domain-containing protein [Treponema sp.]|nr:DUF115 domain-containing protein [Treponema sp.]
MVKNGITLLSEKDPVGRAEKTADSVSIKDKTLYFCPSPIYGYGLSRFLSRLEKEAPHSAVLCLEADNELYKLSIENIDPQITAKKNFLLPGNCTKEELCALVHDRWGDRMFRYTETVRFSGGFQLHAQLYESLCEALRRQITGDLSNALTLAKLGRLYIRNALRNLSLIKQYPSVSQLSFGEAPVLVLGAGPSLDKVLDALSSLNNQAKNRTFKIICVDTALTALKDRGIVPDLAVILESQHWNIRDFIGCSGWNVPAAFDLSSLPASAGKLGAKGFLFFTPWTQLRIFERMKNAGLLPAKVPPLGSVGLTAVEIARRITSGSIICAGIDFSYTAEKYHARSTPGHKSKLNKLTRLGAIFNTSVYEDYSIAALSKSGSKVYTNPIMKNYRNLFEEEFKTDPRIFDIEGTGLPLGVKTISIEEFTSGLLTKEFPPCSPCLRVNSSEINLFYEGEKNRLIELRGFLTGEQTMNQIRLNELVTECDYLWAHFPDYAHNINDITFLKRVRAEIDPMLKILKLLKPLS